MKDALPLIIKRVQDQARDIRSFDMMPEQALASAHALSFIPGQVAVLRVAGEQAYFAFASAPEDAELEFLVKRGYGAGGAIYEMKEGDRIQFYVEVFSRAAPDGPPGRSAVREKEVVDEKGYFTWLERKDDLKERTRALEEAARTTRPGG